MSETMHYFKGVQGRACPRYGTEAFIGCRRGPKGYIWNVDAVVAIPDIEIAPNRKAYASHVRLGDLLVATKEDYDHWLEQRKQASIAKRAERDAERAEQQAAAKKAKAELEAKALQTTIDSTSDGADERAVG